MEYRLLQNKTFKRSENEDLILDMTTTTFQFPDSYEIVDTLYVTESFEMRADLIAYKYYGDVNYSDLLLKINGIRDFLSLTTGDVIVIFSKETLDACLQSPKDLDIDNNSRQINLLAQFTDTSKLSKKDQNRIEYLKKRNEKRQNASKQFIPPTMTKEGETPFKEIDGGANIIFGN